jgi:hypothetical protein
MERLMGSALIVRQLAYLLRIFRRIAKLPQPKLIDLAAEVIELHPSEEDALPPPITLKGQIERATKSFSGELSDAIKFATMTNCIHAATVAYRIENVVFDNGYLYKGLHAEYISSIGRPENKPIQFVDSMLLCSTSSGSGFFGDWLISDNLLEVMAQDTGIEPLKIRPHKSYQHLADLNKLLNLRQYYYQGVCHIRNLYCIEDSGYNEGKRKRLEQLRLNLRSNIRPLSAISRPLVYIERGAAYKSQRDLVNEVEVIDYLSEKGFLILDPTKHSAAEILESIMDCSVVVGIEGSQLAYGLLSLKKGGVMLTLQPPYRFQPSFRPRCTSVGVDWGFIIGKNIEGGFSIDINELDEVLAPYL